MDVESAATLTTSGKPSHPGVAPQTQVNAWHTLDIGQASSALGADVVRGLTEAEAIRRLSQHGPNSLGEAKQRSPLAIFAAQFKGIIVGLLVAAAVVAFALGDVVEGVAILAVILLNAAFGFATEWRARQSLVALKKQSVSTAHVVRDGEERQIPAAELVPGDLVVLAAGDRVPADGRIIESARLQVEEAALTDESVPVASRPSRFSKLMRRSATAETWSISVRPSPTDVRNSSSPQPDRERKSVASGR
jgi:P-type Ca2+ transporter type 2C